MFYIGLGLTVAQYETTPMLVNVRIPHIRVIDGIDGSSLTEVHREGGISVYEVNKEMSVVLTKTEVTCIINISKILLKKLGP